MSPKVDRALHYVKDFIEVASTVLLTAGILKKDDEGKTVVNPIAVKRIVPHWRGAGVEDEASNLVAWAHLEEWERVNLVRLLNVLPGNDDRVIFILTVAFIPDFDDQKTALRAFANMKPDEFVEAVRNLRLIKVRDGMTSRIRQWVGEMVSMDDINDARAFLAPYWENLCDFVANAAEVVNEAAEDLGVQLMDVNDRIEAHRNDWIIEIEARENARAIAAPATASRRERFRYGMRRFLRIT